MRKQEILFFSIIRTWNNLVSGVFKSVSSLAVPLMWNYIKQSKGIYYLKS